MFFHRRIAHPGARASERNKRRGIRPGMIENIVAFHQSGGLRCVSHWVSSDRMTEQFHKGKNRHKRSDVHGELHHGWPVCVPKSRYAVPSDMKFDVSQTI